MKSLNNMKTHYKSYRYNKMATLPLQFVWLMLFFLPILMRKSEAHALSKNSLDIALETANASLVPVPLASEPLWMVPDISALSLNCVAKGHGMSRGRKCTIDGDNYYFKFEPLNSQEFPHRREYFHTHFIRDNIGALTPDCRYVVDKQRFQIGCLELQNLTRADVLHSTSFDRDAFRQNLTLAMDESEIAKLVTSQFFVFDTMKVYNWGIINRQAALLDVDGSYHVDVSAAAAADRTRNQPRSLQDYLQLARDVLRFKQFPGGEPRKDHIGIALSSQNLFDLFNLHLKMLSITTQHVHPTIDLNKDLYESLLSVFIYANMRAQTLLAKTQLLATHPSDIINDYFAQEMEMLAGQLNNNTITIEQIKTLIEPALKKQPTRNLQADTSFATEFYLTSAVSLMLVLSLGAALIKKLQRSNTTKCFRSVGFFQSAQPMTLPTDDAVERVCTSLSIVFEA